MKIDYSMELKPGTDEKNIAKATGKNMNVSFKDAVVIAKHIRGMRLNDAVKMLESVIRMENPLKYLKFNKGMGHRRGMGIAGYPVKAAGAILSVLKNLQSNAEYKGIDGLNAKIIHVQAQRSFTRKRRRPKGRWHLWKAQFVNFQAMIRAGKDKKNDIQG